MKRIPVIIIITLLAWAFLFSCAGAPRKPLARLTVAEIVMADMRVVDLRSNQLVCTGKKAENVDQVEGIMVKGIICQEAEYMSFLYLFNEEPFFFAIMTTNPEHNRLKPLRGYGAMERKGIMSPVDLNSKPRLPKWAYGRDGSPLESIYKVPEKREGQAPEGLR